MTVPSGSLLPTAQPSPPSNAYYRAVKHRWRSWECYWMSVPLRWCTTQKSMERIWVTVFLAIASRWMWSKPYHSPVTLRWRKWVIVFPLDGVRLLVLCCQTWMESVDDDLLYHNFPLDWVGRAWRLRMLIGSETQTIPLTRIV